MPVDPLPLPLVVGDGRISRASSENDFMADDQEKHSAASVSLSQMAATSVDQPESRGVLEEFLANG